MIFEEEGAKSRRQRVRHLAAGVSRYSKCRHCNAVFPNLCATVLMRVPMNAIADIARRRRRLIFRRLRLQSPLARRRLILWLAGRRRRIIFRRFRMSAPAPQVLVAGIHSLGFDAPLVPRRRAVRSSTVKREGRICGCAPAIQNGAAEIGWAKALRCNMSPRPLVDRQFYGEDATGLHKVDHARLGGTAPEHGNGTARLGFNWIR